MSDRVQRAVARLRDGNEDVMKWLRGQCPTPAALSTTITRIRKKMMETLPRPTCESLHAYADEPGVHAFLNSSLSQMVAMQRQHTYDPTWSPDAEAALANLQLLPSNLTALKLSRQELVQHKRAGEQALMAKQVAMLVVANASRWLLHTIALVQTATPHDSVARICIPLLLLTGRRTTELLNGTSKFSPSQRATTCVFEGQLKKRGSARPAEIPLLCDYETIAYGMAVLRARQRYQVLSNEETNNNYHGMLKSVLKGVFPWAPSVHALRGVYAAYVYALYDSSASTFNSVAMKCLLHERLDMSLSYNAVRLEGVEQVARCLGPLP